MMLNTQLFERLTTLFGGRLQPTTAAIVDLRESDDSWQRVESEVRLRW